MKRENKFWLRLLRAKPSQRRQSGQAAIEFIIVVVVVFFFLLFYLSLCMGMVLSEYVEYATFMTARTYKAAAASYELGQKRYAGEVFNSYFYFQGRRDQPKLPETLLKINGIEFDAGGPRGDHKTAGVRVNYEVPFFYLPPIFLPPPPDENTARSSSRLSLTAESYLGREPTLEEVKNDFLRISDAKKLEAGSERFLNQMDDNGF